MNLISIEEELEKIIDRVDNQLKKAKNFIQNRPDIILLVGTTGCGKSTIYNWLIDAEFTLETQNYIKQLSASHPTKRVAQMSSKTVSETKQIQYDYIEDCNLVVIDFPGFQDTNGQNDDFQTQLVLYKLSQCTPIQIIYVIEQQGNEITNRGTDLQKFIISTHFSNNHQSDISIILNKYNEDLNDADIKDCFIKQLQECNSFSQKQPENIYTIRKLNTQTKLEEEFSNKKKKDFKDFLNSSRKISLQVRQLANTETIDQYLMEKKYCLLQAYRQIMQQFVCIIKDDHYDKAENSINNNETQQQILNLNKDIEMKELTLIQLFDIIFNIIQSIWKNFDKDDKIVVNFQQQYSKFKRIFEFYYQFQNQIKSYKDCQFLKDIILEDHNKYMEQIREQIDNKKKQKEEEERISQEQIKNKQEQEERMRKEEIRKKEEQQIMRRKETGYQEKEEMLRQENTRINYELEKIKRQYDKEKKQQLENNEKLEKFQRQERLQKQYEVQMDEQSKERKIQAQYKKTAVEKTCEGGLCGLAAGTVAAGAVQGASAVGVTFATGTVMATVAAAPLVTVLAVPTAIGAMLGFLGSIFQN